MDRLKPLREPARAPFPIERLIESARVVRALPVAFELLGPSRYSDAHMHRSHILPLAHKFRDVMLGIGFGASLGRAIDTLQPQRLFPQTGGAVQQITDRHSRGRTRTRFDRAPEMLREMIGIAERCQLRLDQDRKSTRLN